jgi:GMP synthase (glutamine-hydrolysing)
VVGAFFFGGRRRIAARLPAKPALSQLDRLPERSLSIGCGPNARDSPGPSAMTVDLASRRILIILHQEHSTPGRVGRLLTERGYLLDICRPRFGDPLPETMAEHAGAVIFGGPMSANDADEFIATETDWIGVPLAEEKPFLGLCLGAQMMVRHLGGKVGYHPESRAEVGYYPIRPTANGCALLPEALWPSHVYQWHREGFDCPSSATLLAEGGEDFPVQAIRVGKACYGLQFHPEVTHAMLRRWSVRGAERMELPGAQQREAHIEGWYLYDDAMRRWLDAFLDLWLGEPPAKPAKAE